MDHEQASLLVPELVEERLAPEVAAEVQAHLSGCAECQDLAAAYRRVLRAATEAPGSSPIHPTPEAIVAFSATGGSLTPEAKQRIAAHVEGCSICAEEVASLRAQPVATPSRELGPRTTGPLRLAPPIESWGRRWLAPAFAALAVALLYPAYRGLVDLPRARDRARAQEALVRAMEEDKSGLQNAIDRAAKELREVQEWGGGTAMLVLRPPLREAGIDSPQPVTLAPGQPTLPILLEYTPPVADPASSSQRLEIEVRRTSDEVVVWRGDAELRACWNRAIDGLALGVPAVALAPGEYTIGVRSDDGRWHCSTTAFTIVANSASPGRR